MIWVISQFYYVGEIQLYVPFPVVPWGTESLKARERGRRMTLSRIDVQTLKIKNQKKIIGILSFGLLDLRAF